MLKQKIIIDFGSKVVIQLITAITGIIVARYAGPKILGTVAFGLAYVSTFTFITGFFGPAHTKLIAISKDEGKYNSTYLILLILLVGIFSISVLGFFFSQKYIFHYRFESQEHEWVIIISLITVSLSSLMSYVETTYVGKTNQARANLPNVIRTIIYNILRIIVVIMGMGAIALASVNLLSTLLIIPIFFFLIKDLKFSKFDKTLVGEYFKIALPMFFSMFVIIIMNYIDKIFLQYFSNSTQVGYYTAAYSIGGIFILVAQSAGTLFFPVFSKAQSEMNFKYISDKIRQYERFSFIFFMPFIIFLSLYSNFLITVLLGSKYYSSILPFSILIISSFFVIIAIPYGNLIFALSLYKQATYSSSIKLILFGILLFIFIHPNLYALGATGAAIAVLIINIFNYFLWLTIILKKKILTKDTERIKYFAFFILLYVFWVLIYKVIHFEHLRLFNILYPFIFMIFTYFTMFSFKLIKRKDIIELLDMINIKKSFIYLKSDIKNNQ